LADGRLVDIQVVDGQISSVEPADTSDAPDSDAGVTTHDLD